MARLVSEETLRRLLTLSKEKKLAFLALLYERMVSELHAFCVVENRDFSAFQKLQEQLWRHLGGRGSPIPWHDLRESMLDATPDSEQFGTLAGSSALSAALVAIAIASFVDDSQNSHVTDAIGYTLEAVDANAINELEVLVIDQAVEEYVNSHQLVERERLTEESDVAFLTAMPDAPWPSIIFSNLLNRARTQGTLLGNR